MKKVPRLSDNGKMLVAEVAIVLCTIALIGEVTGLTDMFINSF